MFPSYSSASQLQLCWFDWVQQDLLPGCRLGPYLLHVVSHSTIQAARAATLCGMLSLRRRADQEWEKTLHLEASAPNCHIDTSIHIPFVKAQGQFTRPSPRSVEWRCIFCLLKYRHHMKNEDYVITGAEQKVENNNSVLLHQPYKDLKKKFTVHTKFTRCPQSIVNILTVVCLYQLWLHLTYFC